MKIWRPVCFPRLSRTYSNYKESQRGDSNETVPPRVYLLNQYKEPPISFETAMASLRAYSIFSRPETIEISLKCSMKYKKNKFRQPFRGNVIYPFYFGRDQRVLVFAEDSLSEKAQSAGADIVGGKELMERVSKGMEEFDICLCTPSMLKDVKNLQQILRTKMPTTKKGTVTEEFDEIIKKLKNSREYHCDKRGYITGPVAKLKFSNENILMNIKTLTDAVLQHRLTVPKKTFIQSASVSSTYGPTFPVVVQEIINIDDAT